MEDLEIIRKSSSPYSSPVVVVKKKDGSNRVCIDFRRLNKLFTFDPQPMKPQRTFFRDTAWVKARSASRMKMLRRLGMLRDPRRRKRLEHSWGWSATTKTGITAGSLAAGMMSTAATTGVGGAAVAALQSAGAAGLGAGAVATGAGIGALAGSTVDKCGKKDC
ncbi:Reverse transcriptases (RTs) from retrotransposons domain-containing protein [Elysia marginata]|uniref:Reverse transcriptases (RTs) from retrotransposons domain-containing protein n=1 Tax=Elysia marginata TaxID=1093978 RepID=A0AAV4FT00_9GAST|nr:Reverse transcriptases (RTs) from retrotransposons domain-containing protein [Elysia marginata]